MVTHRPGEQRTDEVSIQAGYVYKEASPVEVDVGGLKVRLFTEGESAWTVDKDSDKKLVQAMIKGSTMVVEGTSARGTNTKDTYSLSGFTRAYQASRSEARRVGKECVSTWRSRGSPAHSKQNNKQ